MDLQGQAASESDGFRHISGTGGQLQLVRSARDNGLIPKGFFLSRQTICMVFRQFWQSQ